MIRYQDKSLSQKLEHLGSSVYLSISKLIKSKWLIVAVVLISAFVSFVGLGQSSLKDWDEAIYAEVAKQMVERGEYLTQYYNGELRFEKPPLVPWIMAAIYKIFSINEFWARAVSAISAVFLSIIVYLIGRILYSPQVGFIAVITMMSMYEVAKRARFATTDIMLTLFIYLAVFAYLKLEEKNPVWWYVIWTAFGLAFMVKYWAAFLIPVTLIFAIVFDGKTKLVVESKQFWRGAVLAALIITPWHIIMIARHGRSFIEIFVLRNLIGRSTTTLISSTRDQTYYLRYMQRTFVPWLYMLPVAVALEVKDFLFVKSRSSVLLVLATLTIVLYSLVISTKLQWYILPVYPALAIFIASSIEKAYWNYKTIAFAGLVFATSLGLIVSPDRFIVFYLVLIIPAGIVAVRYLGKIRIHQVATLAMYGFLLALSALNNVKGYNAQPLFTTRQAPIAELARTVNQLNPVTESPIIGVALNHDIDKESAVEGPAATFYSNRTVEVVDELEKLSNLVREGEEREIFIAEKYVEALSDEYNIDVVANVDPLVYGIISSK